MITRQRRRPHSAGSAFILALIALLVLSIVGIALASLTQTEMSIGGNERTSGRIFYASDAGYNLVVARKLVLNDATAETYVMPDSRVTLGTVDVRDQVELTVVLPVLTAPCNLCQINNATSYSSNYVRANSAFTVLARRVGVKADKTTTTTIAQRTIGAMMDIQPTQVAPEKVFVNAAETAKIKW